MSKITGILPVESAGAPARIPRAQKDGAIESGCRAASEPRGRTKGAAACRFACPALVFDGITKRAGHGQLRGGYREDPGGARVPWPKRRGGGGITGARPRPKVAGAAAQLAHRRTRNAMFDWPRIASGRMPFFADAAATPPPRPFGPMRHHARLPSTSRTGAVAAPRPLLGAKTGRNRPLGPFFSPRICACAECAGVLGEEGGWRGARAARKTAIPRCWRRDRPRMAPALHRHRRLRPAGRPAGPNTCPGGQAGGMQRAPAAAAPAARRGKVAPGGRFELPFPFGNALCGRRRLPGARPTRLGDPGTVARGGTRYIQV